MSSSPSELLKSLELHSKEVETSSRANNGSISVHVPEFKLLLGSIHSIFTHGIKASSSEDIEKEIRELLSEKLKSVGQDFAAEFCKESFVELSNKEISFCCYVMMIGERFASSVLNSLQNDASLSQKYSESACLLSPGFLEKMKEVFASLEKENVKLMSKWLKSFEKMKAKYHSRPSSPTPDDHSPERSPESKEKSLDLEILNELPENDPIRQWLAVKSSPSPSHVKSTERSEDQPKILVASEIKAKTNSPNLNLLFNATNRKLRTPQKTNLSVSSKNDDSSAKRDRSKEIIPFDEKEILDLAALFPKHEAPSTISQVCFLNGEPLSNRFFFRNATFCEIIGEWVCEGCLAPQRNIIPWRVVQELDFRPRAISKKGEELLNAHFTKPFLTFQFRSELAKNQAFSNFVIERKTLYLMFKIICDRKIILEPFDHLRHLFWSDLVLSPQNVADFRNFSTLSSTEIAKLKSHFSVCDLCGRRKKKCPVCQQRDIFGFDILNTELCRQCNTLFHKECFFKRQCSICLQAENGY